MRLLVAFNLSPRLIPLLAELFPVTEPLRNLGFGGETDDEIIWEYARDKGFTLLTSDGDFLQIAERRGHPPKIIRHEKMNYRARFAGELLQRNAIRIAEFELSDLSVLVLKYR